MYKLLVFDIDGTLVNDKKEVTLSTKESLSRAKQQGIDIVISSGRPFTGVKLIANQVGRDLVQYVSCFNGAHIVDLHTENTIYQAFFKKEEVQEIVNYGLEKGVDVNSYDLKNVLSITTPKYSYVKYEADTVAMPYIVSDFRKGDEPISKMMLTADPEILERVLNQIPGHFFERYSIVRSTPFFLEFTPKGVTKASGLERLGEKIHINQQEVMTFGDQENDASMIEWAGCGVAMGNAVPSLKERADFVTKSNEEEGITYALDALIFNQGNRV